ncbi:tetratricopeptide repeat protein [Streptomyces sp. RFCAC02]|uniref:tetratricopeptide repeat protein n=1 Tax=Streptomyces sp. RFCAC02 TaxID=2499143 RepID=UPI00101EDC6F|nr:tetratricopeptide repeat protein [Streptomyces sp. RFCAC02]
MDGQDESGGRIDLRHAQGVLIGSGVQHNTYVLPAHHVEWPHRVGVVPPPAACFHDRGDLADPPAGEPVTTYVLTGLGGVGKTQLAAHWARIAQARGDLDLLVWVPAASRQAVVAVYAEAAADVCPGQVADADQAAARFVAWLERTDRRWMVVLDDVTAPGDLHGLWPPQRPGGTTLVTTRRKDAALAGEGRGLVDVGLFTPDEAAGYLTRRLGGDPGRLTEAGELADDLGRLPLALAQACAYMLDQDMGCGAYRARLADRARRLDSLLPEASALPDQQRLTVAAAWALSIELADGLNPAGLARPVLELSSVLSPNGIPAGLYTTAAARAFLAAARGGREVDAEDARGAVRCLHRLSLVSAGPDGAPVQVHGLVQRTVREQLGPRRESVVVGRAADALHEMWPRTEREYAFGQLLRANAEALQDHGGALLWSGGDVHPVLLRAGQSLGTAGLLNATMAHYRRLASAATAYLGPDHLRTLASRSNAVRFLALAGDPPGAVAAYEDLLADFLRLAGPDDPRTLDTRREIAAARAQGGDRAGALTAYDRLYDDCVRVFGPRDRETLDIRFHVAKLLNDTGDTARATALCQELLRDCLRALGPSHSLTLDVRMKLADLRGDAGDPAGAVAACEQLLADCLATIGADHRDALSVRRQLAHWRGAAGDPAGAIADLEALLDDSVRVLGPHHIDVSAARFDLGLRRSEAGHPAGPMAAIEQAAAGMEQLLGAGHPLTITHRVLIAAWKTALLESDPAGAAAAMEELLPELVAAAGPDDPGVLMQRRMLAGIRGAIGDPAAAAREFAGLLADFVRVLGPEHPQTFAVRADLADWRSEADAPDGAVPEAEDVLGACRRVLGPTHPETLHALQVVAKNRRAAGDTAGAAAAYEDLIDVRRRVLGPDHPETLRARGTLADLRSEDADPADAVADHEELFADHLRVLGPEHPRTLDVRGRVLTARGEAGDPAGAAAAYGELLQDYQRLLGPDHMETLVARTTYAGLLAQAKEYARSAATYERVLTAGRRIWSPEHFATLMIRGCLAEMRSHVDGDPASGLPAFDALLADCVRALGPDHYVTDATRAYIAGLRERDATGAEGEAVTFHGLLESRGKAARAAGGDSEHVHHSPE